MNNTFISGDWNVICDVCGQKYKASALKKRWDGLMVCPSDFERRHPQDFLRVPADNSAAPWSRPEVEPDTFIGGQCTINGLSAIPGYFMAGCAIPSRTFIEGSRTICTTESSSSFPGYASPGCAIPNRLF